MNVQETSFDWSRSYAQYIRHLRVLLAVFSAGGTAQAARVLPLSQPAIARAVRDLETALGLTLFERVARGMLPTTEGRLLAHRAQRAVDQLNYIERDLANLKVVGRPSGVPGFSRFALGCAYRHFVTYLIFCETQAETQTAQQLGVSQAAVSQTLRQLEHLANSQLFQRTHRSMRLTEPGAVVLRRLKLARDELCRARNDLSALKGRVQGRIRIGSLPLTAGSLVPEAVSRVLARYPDLRARITDGTYDALQHQLLHADLDVVVGALRADAVHPDLVQEVVFKDSLVVVARQGHPLQGRRLSGLQDVAHLEWIAPLAGSSARKAFERAFAAAGASVPEHRLEANSMAIQQALLANSDRLALLSPLMAEQAVVARALQILSVPVAPMNREVGLIMRADTDPGVGVQAFIEEMRSMVLAAVV